MYSDDEYYDPDEYSNRKISDYYDLDKYCDFDSYAFIPTDCTDIYE